MKVSLTLLVLFTTVCIFAQREHVSSKGIEFVIIDSKYLDSKDGAIIPNITKGYRPFYYLWTGPENFTSMDSVLRNAKPGLYVLKIEDALCGKFSDTLEIKSMDRQRSYDFLVTSIGPNPFKEEIVIGIETRMSQVVDVKLFHSSGTMVIEKTYELVEGVQHIEINNLIVTPGIYIIQICNENNCRTTKRLIKVNS